MGITTGAGDDAGVAEDKVSADESVYGVCVADRSSGWGVGGLLVRGNGSGEMAGEGWTRREAAPSGGGDLTIAVPQNSQNIGGFLVGSRGGG